MLRHCRHVGGKKQYIFSPLGNKIYFHAKLFNCFSPPTWPPWKPSIVSEHNTHHFHKISYALHGDRLGAKCINFRKLLVALQSSRNGLIFFRLVMRFHSFCDTLKSLLCHLRFRKVVIQRRIVLLILRHLEKIPSTIKYQFFDCPRLTDATDNSNVFFFRREQKS